MKVKSVSIYETRIRAVNTKGMGCFLYAGAVSADAAVRQRVNGGGGQYATG
ncbi:hypothetical protein [Jeongeupia naejangsanensis]|uniref:hypothetical protein n=1 Tax=Jeongeupia naejangsanensis TaxID=613195 RepID=UPI0036D35FB2